MSKRFARRKWGWYLVLLDRKHFKVKILRFYKGGEISQQKHLYRHELWLFLSGSGEAKFGKDSYSVSEGTGFRVKPEQWHWYKADKSTLVLEIQYGERCDEEDIVRI